MSVAPLFSPPQQGADWLRWGFFNFDHHVQVSNYILATKNLMIARLIIYPLPTEEGMGAWFLNHQSWHTQINSVLGTRSNNLLAVDFKNSDALAAWVFLHATEHQAWEQMTGVA